MYSKLLFIIFNYSLIFSFSFGKSYRLNFGSKNSAFKISSGARFNVTSTNLTFTDGTLSKNYDAQISGNKITFANSILEDSGVENLMTGVYDPSASRSVFLGGDSFLKAEPGCFLEKVNVLRWGNKIEGQPIFLNSDAIRLENAYSELTLNVQSALNTNIELNGGRITLSSDFSFADDRNFTGSGVVDLLGHSLKLGDSQITHTIDWLNAADINLHRRTNLSGTWNFNFGRNVLNGHGNILDLSTGGTLWLRSGVTAEFTDVVIKGLGINKGWIDFQDDTSKIIMSNVTLELDDRFRVSKGSFYVEGPVTIILKNHDLIFDQLATLMVDGVTLWKDNVQYAGDSGAGDIVFGSLLVNRALIDSGAISTILPGEFVEYNSNAIVTLDAELEELSGDVRANSRNIVYNSNAIVKLEYDDSLKLIAIKNNSNAIVKNTDDIRYNSNAIISGSISSELSRQNSNAIVVLDLREDILEGSVRANSRNIVYNSNAIVKLEYDDSLKFIAIKNNSNAIVKNTDDIRYNSNAIVTLDLREDILEGSVRANSRSIVYNSNVIIKNTSDIRYNSNAILSLGALDLSVLEGAVRANSRNIVYNSNAILNVSVPNLNVLEGAVRANSRNIICNSNAIVKDTSGIRYNSNAILSLGALDLSILEGAVRANSKNIVYNSNSIINLQEVLLNPLTQGPLTVNISLDNSYLIGPSQRIFVDGNVTINGNGAVLIFADPNHSQFIVAPGKTVTLKNLQLLRLNENTFDLRVQKIGNSIADGKINIAENVIFEFSENMTFSHGSITLVNSSSQEANVFFIRGGDGRKQISLNPDSRFYLQDRSMINLGHNTLALQHVVFDGIENISHVTDNFAGAIGLVGDAIVGVGNEKVVISQFEKNNGIKEICDKVFVIEGSDNKILFKKNDLKFTGEMLFADFGDNNVHLNFMLTEKLSNDLIGVIPVVNFDTGFMNLTSLYGLAGIIFDDELIKINNSPNGFVAEENSFLSANNLIITGDPIWDFYDPLIVGNSLAIKASGITSPDLDSAIIVSTQTLTRTLKDINHTKTALHSLSWVRKNKIKQNELDPCAINNINFDREVLLTKLDPSDFFPVGAFVQKYPELETLTFGNAFGYVLAYKNGFENFWINETELLSLMLTTNSILFLANQSVELKKDDKILVVGKNKIVVSEKFIINGSLLFDQDSELVFEFDSLIDDAQVYFAHDYLLDLKPGCKLIFKGKGTVFFGDGSVIQLSGTDANNKPSFVIENSSLLNLDNLSSAMIRGKGKILIDDGAEVNINGGQHLIIGSQDTDEIDIKVDRNGVLRIASIKDEILPAIISIHKAIYSLNFEQAGRLAIGNHGILELNSLDNKKSVGYLTNFTFDKGGILNIDKGGVLRIGYNRIGAPDYKELKFKWDNLDSQIQGSGLVELVGTSFAGKIQDRYIGNIEFNSTDLVRFLTGVVPELKVSTVFMDFNGNKKIRMVNGNIFDLLDDDDVRSDDERTGYAYGTNKNRPFIIYPSKGKETGKQNC